MTTILKEVLAIEDPRWNDGDWVSGYLPTGVPFRWRRLVCQAPGCDAGALTCVVQGEAGDWNYVFTPESDFVADTNEDSLYCERHTKDIG